LDNVEVVVAQQHAVDKELSAEGVAVLTRVSHLQRLNHLKGAPVGSVAASDRLMKELREIYRSQNYKNGYIC
jgi:ubiquitin-conjugating enzyme E2 Q